MKLTPYTDASVFLHRAQTWLESREAENSLMLGLAFRLQRSPGRFKSRPYMAVVEEDGRIVQAALMTPPYNLILAGEATADALRLLARHLQEWPVPGVLGPRAASQAFAQAWMDHRGGTAVTSMRHRIYELREVTPPIGVPGSMREAGPQDIPLFTGWISAFQHEALGETAAREAAHELAEQLVSDRDGFLWEHEKPVSIAARRRPTRHGVTVSLVYTPPEQRRKGYAGACVAALSQYLLDSGYSFCTLFTDLANPTSNRIYQNIGYRPVCDFDELRFSIPVG